MLLKSYQLKLTCKFLFLALMGVIQTSWSLAATEYLPEKRAVFFRQLSTSFMQVVEPGSPYFEEDLEKEVWILSLLRFFSESDLLRNAPTGEPNWSVNECRAENFARQILEKSPVPLEVLAQKYTKHFQKCRENLETGRNDILRNTLGVMSISMDPNHHPFARHVMFHLPNNIKLKGLLAMKTDGKSRPLIIFRTGIFSNTQTFIPERYLFMQAFEQSPFNILVLESLSGSEFMKHNSSLAIGGFDEGLQNFLIAKELQDPRQPISKLIQGVHLLGMSMGANGALFASLLNELNPNPTGAPIISSALAYCPLLNMRDTLDFHLTQGLAMDVMNFWAARRVPALKTRYPDLDPENFIASVLKKMEADYRGPMIAEKGELAEMGKLGVPGHDGMVSGIHLPASDPGFWPQNNFWSKYQNIKTPVLIFATRKDPIVSWFVNSGRIEDGRMNFSNSNLKLIPLEKGFHCSLPVSYDWHQQTTLLQTYFLNFSPELQLTAKEFRAPLSQEALEYIHNHKTELIIQTKFEVPLGSAALSAQVTFQKSPNPSFFEGTMNPQMKLQLPLSEMEFPIEEIVSSRYESELLRRWANQNITTTIQSSDLVFAWKKR